MRSYRIDDLMPEHCAKIRKVLDEMELGGGLEGLYWLPVPAPLLSDIQCQHSECAPHVMALVVEDDYVQMEFLVRSKNMLRCDCVSYASTALEQHMMRYVDDLFRQSGVSV